MTITLPRSVLSFALLILCWWGVRSVGTDAIDRPGATPAADTRLASLTLDGQPPAPESGAAPGPQEAARSIGPGRSTRRVVILVRRAPLPPSTKARLPDLQGAAHPVRQANWSWLRAPRNRRWSLSAWTFVRSGLAGSGIAPASQLGGGQSGFRFQRSLFEKRGLAFSANVRFSAATNVPGKELGVGIAARRAGRVPVELIVERRVGLDSGGRDAMAALLVSGVDDVRLPTGTLLSGYVQTGIVGVRSRDAFVDGSARIEKPVANIGKAEFRLGGGIWGAAQPGVSRVDIGPSLVGKFRLGRSGVRVSGEWRQRVAGNALPGSGPALTVGLDY